MASSSEDHRAQSVRTIIGQGVLEQTRSCSRARTSFPARRSLCDSSAAAMQTPNSSARAAGGRAALESTRASASHGPLWDRGRIVEDRVYILTATRMRVSRDRERQDRRIVNARIGMVNAKVGIVNTAELFVVAV